MMTKMLGILTIACVCALSATPAIAADNKSDDAEHFEKRVEQLNTAAKEPGVIKLAIKRISTETGVPEERIRGQHKRNPEMGLAGLLLANVLAAETKKNPGHFIDQRLKGQKWPSIARENNVSLDKLNVRLDNLHREIAPAAKR